MEEPENLPVPGERCRLRGRKPTGLVSFVDLETGWARVDWDEEYRDTPEIWQHSSLGTEETGRDLDVILADSVIQDQQGEPDPLIFPTGFSRIVLRVVRAIKFTKRHP